MNWRLFPRVRFSLFLLFTTLILASGCGSSGRVMIQKVTPDGKTPRSTNITITFSHPIVDKDLVGITLDSAAVTTDPTLPARYRWASPTTLQIMPEQPLSPATEYNLTINPEIITNPTQKLGGKNQFRLTTPPLSILSATPLVRPESGDPSRVRISFEVAFDDVVDMESLKKYLTLRWEKGEFHGNIEFELMETRGKSVYRVLSAPVQRGRNTDNLVQLVINKNLSPIGGELPMYQDFKTSVSVNRMRELTVRRLQAGQQGKQLVVNLYFSSPLNMETAKDFIQIEPEQDFELTQQYRGSILLTGGFSSGDEILVKIEQGLQAADGARLASTFSQRVSLPDYNPYVEFAAPGTYLSKKGLKNIGLNLMNSEHLTVEVRKIYINNLVSYLLQRSHSKRSGGYSVPVGKRVFEEVLRYSGQRNEEVKATVSLGDFLGENPTGLFQVGVQGARRSWQKDIRTVMLTDIGLIAKRINDEIAIWALSTETLRPQPGLKVQLLSRTNQVMKSGTTDQNGKVLFTGIEPLLHEFTPYVITAQRGEEYSYLLFEETDVSHSDFDTDGRPTLTSGYEAFLYGDRGVYRPGETAHIVSITRQPKFVAPVDLPIRLEVRAPDGSIFANQRGRCDVQGMSEFELEIPVYSRTGKYNARLFVGQSEMIGTYNFSVEEFLPDRIQVDVTTDKRDYFLGDEVQVTVFGKMLFGPPAAGRTYSVNTWFDPAPFSPSNYSEYTFTNPDGDLAGLDKAIGNGTLDKAGKAELTFTLPEDLRPPAAVLASIEATVQEKGGRAVSGRNSLMLHAYPFYLGLKRSKTGYAKPGDPETFQWVALDYEGNPVRVEGIEARLSRVRWNSVLESDSRGRARYISHRYVDLVSKQSLDAGEGGSFTLNPAAYGKYEVTLLDQQSGAETGITFYTGGGGYSPWSMEHPDRINITLDRESYPVGGTVKALIQAPMAGKLLLTVERERLLYSRLITMPQNTAEVELPVLDSFGPNAYVSATLVRSPGDGDSHAPMRAYGVVPLPVDMSRNIIPLTLDCPTKVEPGTQFEVKVSARGADRNAQVTVAVVDEGILQLTEFETPSAHDFFYAQRRLEVDTYDIFGMMLPEVEEAEIHSSPGGGRDMRRRSHVNSLSQARVKPVALWSGVVPLKNGRATVQFDLPDFNGQLRVMALAVSGDQFGSADKDVTVSAPVVLTPYLPRFISGHDSFDAMVNVTNVSGQAADIKVSLKLSGPIEALGDTLWKTIHLENNADQDVRFRLTARPANALANVTFVANGGDVEVQSTTQLPVRPPVAPVSISGYGAVTAKDASTFTFPDELMEEASLYSIVVTSMPNIRFAKSIDWLLRYPYGCLEQTTSKAFPLLYFDTLAKVANPGQFEGNAPEYYVEAAIARIISMQDHDGHFRFWPTGGRTNPWAGIYALHFLNEAKRLGYAVPEGVLKDGSRYLHRVIDYNFDHRFRLPGGSNNPRSEYYWLNWNEGHRFVVQAYALYVLTRYGEPEPGAMYRLRDVAGDKLTEEAKLFLAGAYFYAGDRENGQKLLPNAISSLNRSRQYLSGRTFHSPMREGAIALYILQQVAPDHYLIPKLAEELNERFDKKQWRTTQDNAWAMIAMGEAIQRAEQSNYHGTITSDGHVLKEFGTDPMRFADSTLFDKKVKLEIEGEGTCYYYWEARGLPTTKQFIDVSEGLEVRRRYYTDKGEQLSVKDIKQGEMIRAQISVVADAFQQNVVINDLLPAGFEIENMRLETSQRNSDLPPNTIDSDAMDIRDDRLLLYTNLAPGREVFYTYVLRAVTAGTFTLPPITAECMYNPDIRASSSSGFVTVVR